MFGTAAFGQIACGQIVGQVFTSLAVTAALSVAPQAALAAPSPLAAVSGCTLATAATLTTGTNRFEASAGISLGTQAPLALRANLATHPTITIGVGEPIFDPAIFDGSTLFDTRRRSSTQLLVSGPFLAAPTLTVGVAAPNLAVGAIAFTADTSVLLGTTATLRSLPATFAATVTIPIGIVGNLVKTGYGFSSVVIAFNGAITQNVRRGSISISDELNEAPNTCDFIVDGSPPSIGTDVRIGLRDLQAANLLFGGEVLKVMETFSGQPSHPAWQVNCRDYAFLLNRRKVWAKYTQTSATTIALELLQQYTTGFSTTGIVAGLPAIDVEFDGVDVLAALSKIATLIGGYCDVTAAKVVRLFITNTDPPLTLTDTDPLFKMNPPLGLTRDLSQVRTVVKVKGIGKSVAGNSGMRITAGDTLLPLEDTEPFGTAAGQAITDDQQILNYTATTPGGIPAKVGNTSAPPGSLIAAIATGVVGGLIGNYRWAVAFANAAGETPIGTPSNQLACPDRTSPVSTIGLGPTGNVGPLVGRYGYKVANVTSRGTTLLGPETARVASALSRPPAPSVSTASGPGPLMINTTYAYAASYVTPYGETDASLWTSYTPPGISIGSVTTADVFSFGGIIDGPYYVGISIVTALGELGLVTTYIGTNHLSGGPGGVTIWSWNTGGRIESGYRYYYACTAYHDTYGETPLGPSVSFFNNSGSALKFTIQLPSALANQTGLRLYRRAEPVTDPSYSSAYQLVGEYGGGGYQILDNYSQGELGDKYPKQGRAGVRIRYTLSASSESGIYARRIYRTKSGGAEYFLIGEIQNNAGGQQWLDLLDDNALTQRSPAVPTTGRAAFVTPPSGPSGITGRRIYRTKGNGSQVYLAGEVKDNGTSGWVDTVPDNTLTVGPNMSPAGIGEQHLLTSIPIGPPGTLARALYRTKSGGSEFFLLGRVSDNTSGTFVDNVPDANLGEGGPLVNTAGASAAQLSNIPIGGSGVTKRILYRTNGSADPATFKYLATIDNNTDTTFVDDKPDSDLGRPPSEATNLGALPGDIVLNVDKTIGFPSAGWVRADSQYIRYTGISGLSLIGIPPVKPVAAVTRSGNVATMTVFNHGWQTNDVITVLGANQSEYNGVRKITVLSADVFTYKVEGFPVSPGTGTISAAPNGAITAPIAGGNTILTVPMLTGVSSLIRPVQIGATVSLWVVRSSSTGIAQLQTLEGGDGIREYNITDSSLESIAACQQRGDADLALFQFAQITLTYRTQDTTTRSGRTVHVTLPPPYTLTGDFLIQSVHISNIDQELRTLPFFDVTLSSTRFSLEDVIRHVVLTR